MTSVRPQPRVLIVTSMYLPGYKAGGPIRSVANLVQQLGTEFQFTLLTNDRDLGDVRPYPGVGAQTWHPVGNARVRYLAPAERQPWSWRRLLRSLEYDALYLNGFFAHGSVMTLWLRRLGQLPNRPVILAPRGEFSRGALGLKSLKKRWYLRLAQASQLWRGLVWQASSEYELEDIRRLVGPHPQVLVAPPLVTASPAHLARRTNGNGLHPARSEKRPGHVRLVYLSRISPMKNLEMALACLAETPGQIEFDIYGPIEDQAYWRKCQELLGRLAPSVQVRYCGPVAAENVGEVLSRYHFLLFPTRGENYGHVIAEALAAGCPVLTSDQTPWRGLHSLSIGWDLPLTDLAPWRQVLQQCLAMDQSTFEGWSTRARAYMGSQGLERAQNALQANRRLFYEALQWAYSS